MKREFVTFESFKYTLTSQSKREGACEFMSVHVNHFSYLSQRRTQLIKTGETE